MARRGAGYEGAEGASGEAEDLGDHEDTRDRHETRVADGPGEDTGDADQKPIEGIAALGDPPGNVAAGSGCNKQQSHNGEMGRARQVGRGKDLSKSEPGCPDLDQNAQGKVNQPADKNGWPVRVFVELWPSAY